MVTIVDSRKITAQQDVYSPGTYYTTFYADDENYIADTNTQVFYADKDEQGKISLKEVSDRIIKKSQGVILKSSESEIKLYATNQTADYTSLLTGTTQAIENVAESVDGDVYVVGTSAKGGIGFYKWTGSIQANKAFLRRAE